MGGTTGRCSRPHQTQFIHFIIPGMVTGYTSAAFLAVRALTFLRTTIF